MHHLLIVDDEPDVVDVFSYYFESIGYRVTVAKNGSAALEADAADPADLVITDLSMPGMDGREMALRLHQRRPYLPIIMMSGFAGEELLVHGTVSLFIKPVGLAALGSRVEEMLAQCPGQ